MIYQNPPKLSYEERQEALEKAKAARRKRAEVKEKLQSQELSVADVIAMKDDEAIGRLKVIDLISSLPGIGNAKAEKAMREIDIAMSRRIKGLGQRQAKELIDRFSF